MPRNLSARFLKRKIAELKEMCVEAEFPEEEWGNLSKALLSAYILKKYDEAIADSEEYEE